MLLKQMPLLTDANCWHNGYIFICLCLFLYLCSPSPSRCTDTRDPGGRAQLWLQPNLCTASTEAPAPQTSPSRSLKERKGSPQSPAPQTAPFNRINPPPPPQLRRLPHSARTPILPAGPRSRSSST